MLESKGKKLLDEFLAGKERLKEAFKKEHMHRKCLRDRGLSTRIERGAVVGKD